MGVEALVDAFAYVDLLDFTGSADDLRLMCQAEQREKTNFRSGGWREFANGLKTSTFDSGNFWSSDAATDLDAVSFDGLGVANRVITLGTDETEGEYAYFVRGMQPSYSWLEGNVGDLAKCKVQAVGSDGAEGVVRGRLAKAYGDVSATGATGTAMELGAVGAAQYLYASFHVFGTPGTTITAVVESDADNTFGSATTRITFGPYTTAGGRWATRVAGSITDTWWRVNVTAITGTFTIACAIGIQ